MLQIFSIRIYSLSFVCDVTVALNLSHSIYKLDYHNFISGKSSLPRPISHKQRCCSLPEEVCVRCTYCRIYRYMKFKFKAVRLKI